MGVKSLIESPMLARFVATHTADPDQVALINASPMVELVENGSFLFDPDATQFRVSAFMEDVRQRGPDIDVFTLFSTHLPWLASFFARARCDCAFLDPAQDIVAGLTPSEGGSGQIMGLVTESGQYRLSAFKQMLEKLGIDIPLQAVTVP